MEIRGYKPSKNDSEDYKKEMYKLRALWKIEEEYTEDELAEIEKFDSQLK